MPLFQNCACPQQYDNILWHCLMLIWNLCHPFFGKKCVNSLTTCGFTVGGCAHYLWYGDPSMHQPTERANTSTKRREVTDNKWESSLISLAALKASLSCFSIGFHHKIKHTPADWSIFCSLPQHGNVNTKIRFKSLLYSEMKWEIYCTWHIQHGLRVAYSVKWQSCAWCTSRHSLCVTEQAERPETIKK